jgi:hypothetical protein
MSKLQHLGSWLLLCSVGFGQQPIAEMQSKDATVHGAVMLTGTGASILTGAQIHTLRTSATLRLTRGGELQLCPQSDVTITASSTGKEHLVALNAGAIETHYRLGSSADIVMTPDFRLQLPGPGDFHFAIRLEPQGNVCVESLPGNTSAVIVQEMMSDGTHEVRPGERLMFGNGIVTDAGIPSGGCACPPVPEQTMKSPTELGFPEQQSRRAAEAIASGEPVPEPPALPGVASVEPGAPQVQITAPMVFSGDGAADAPPLPELTARAQLLPASFPNLTVPVEKPKPRKRNFFQKLGSILGKLFQ